MRNKLNDSANTLPQSNCPMGSRCPALPEGIRDPVIYVAEGLTFLIGHNGETTLMWERYTKSWHAVRVLEGAESKRFYSKAKRLKAA